MKIRTDTIELPLRNQRNYYYNNGRDHIKKPKITIIMKRSPDFFKNMEEFERIREEAIKQEEIEMAKNKKEGQALVEEEQSLVVEGLVKD